MAKKIQLPDDAPFTEEQKKWLQSFLTQVLSEPEPAAAAGGAPVTILWGSQTGNAEGLAKKTAKALNKAGFTAESIDMAAYDHARLPSEERLLIITSTYGDGEAPDNAQALHEYLGGDQAPKLDKVNFAILALGDTDYPDFCQTGIDFEQFLTAAGAKPLMARVDCDVDFDDLYAQWRKDILAMFGASNAAVEVNVAETGPEPFGKKNPFPSPILKNYNLNGEGSAKETNHIELSLEGSDYDYQAGDALGVFPVNPADVVDEIIKSLPFDTNDEVPFPDGSEGSLRDALMYHYDIRKITKAFVTKWQARSGSPMLRAIVESGSKEAMDDFCWGRELVDLVVDHPADFADGEEFVGILKKLAPRLYSISSSPNAHPGEVHLTIGIVRYDSNYRSRGGVCSTFFADRAEGVQPGCFVHHNKAFRLPEDKSTDIIMVGPGTGIAPFRAFLEERQVSEATGRNWLFFGDQHAATDYLYQEQIEQFQKDGVLNQLDLAFSRDQADKIYVQTRMLEKGAELWAWLDGGASFYVCGDASRMAKDVDAALHTIAQEHGGLSADEAIAFIKDLRKAKRYNRDVY